MRLMLLLVLLGVRLVAIANRLPVWVRVLALRQAV
jgi:hypothetical protein